MTTGSLDNLLMLMLSHCTYKLYRALCNVQIESPLQYNVNANMRCHFNEYRILKFFITRIDDCC